MAETPPLPAPDAEAAREPLVFGVEEPPLPAHGDAESAAWSRARLQELGFTQGAFARFTPRRGGTRSRRDAQRGIQRMCAGRARVPGEKRVPLAMLLRSKQRKMTRIAKGRAGARRRRPWAICPKRPAGHPAESKMVR